MNAEAEAEAETQDQPQAPKKHVRDGWLEASKAIAAAGDDWLRLGEFPNDDDVDLVW